jgi:hypothetical protein
MHALIYFMDFVFCVETRNSTNLSFVHGIGCLTVVAMVGLPSRAQPELVPLLHVARLLLERIVCFVSV